PPSPCKVCGSAKHWDKECGHWHEYETRRAQGVLYVESERHADDAPLYNALYPAFANNTAFFAYMASSDAPLLPAALLRAKPFVEDVEDEYHIWYKSSPKAQSHILEEMGRPSHALLVPSVMVEEVEDEYDKWYKSSPKARSHLLEDATDWRRLPAAGPPPPEAVFKVPPVRSPPSGYSSVGVSVLSCRGRVGSLDDKTITLRMDSGASLTLVDEGYLQKLHNPPKIRTGLKVEIAQLTDKAPRIKGYVRVPVFIQDEDGLTLEFETEAYVVPGMTVDVLLGEDWHLNHEIGVLRDLQQGTRVRAQSFVKAKSHRRAKAARHRRKLALRSGALRAFEDVVIPPSSTCNVTIAGDLRGKKEWYVERNLVPVKGDVFLTVPNTIITTDPKPVLDAHGEPTIAVRSVLPVTNPTARPYVLRAGTLLAFAKDPKEYLDTPSSQEQLDEYNASAQVLATL
ncbi:hypothetical protein EXIGLDRAFT_570919, partial [Exidia glandulosa HHB12029]